MSNITSTQYSLQLVENFYPEISDSLTDILYKYKLLITEYLNFFIENIKMSNKSPMYAFIIIRGLETISHVFNYILYHSKNIDMAYYHGQKAYFFFIEFITQISDESHIFLQLNSRDAVLFVYKKTIFEISPPMLAEKKISHSKDEMYKLDILEQNIFLFKNIICFMIQNDDSISSKNISIYVANISHLLNHTKVNLSSFKLINTFIDTITLICDKNPENYYSFIDLFIKKYFKIIDNISNNNTRDTHNNKIKNKIYSHQGLLSKVKNIADFEKWVDSTIV